jgi:hypothetical protein
MPASKLESIEQSCEHRGIPSRHLRNMIRDGVVPPGVFVRLGRRVFVNPDRLDAWLDAGGGAFPGGWRRKPSAPTS